MSADPRIPTRSGRSTWCLHRPGRDCLHQAQSAVRRSASRMKGELHPTWNRFVRRTGAMDDSVNELVYFSVWPLPETFLGGTTVCNCLLGASPDTTRDTIISLARTKGCSPRTTDLCAQPLAVTDRRKKKRRTRCPGCPARVLSSERHVLQCRCQSTPTQPIENRLGGGVIAPQGTKWAMKTRAAIKITGEEGNEDPGCRINQDVE